MSGSLEDRMGGASTDIAVVLRFGEFLKEKVIANHHMPVKEKHNIDENHRRNYYTIYKRKLFGGKILYIRGSYYSQTHTINIEVISYSPIIEKTVNSALQDLSKYIKTGDFSRESFVKVIYSYGKKRTIVLTR